MTRLFTEGFESGDVLGFDAQYADVVASTAYKRSGNYSAFFTRASDRYLIKNVAEGSEFYFRLAFFYPLTGGANENAVFWKNNTTTLGSVVCGLSTITLKVGTSAVATGSYSQTLDGSWHLLEIHIKLDNSVGVIETKLNGILVASFSGDTIPSTITTIDRMYIGDAASTYDVYYDDIAINDASGSVDNSWCGDGHVIALTPSGVGNASELTPSSGSVNYLMVDEVPSDGDTTYVSGSVAETKDLYNFTPTGLYSGSHVVLRAFVETRTRDTSGSAPFATVIQSGSSVVEETAQYTTLSYASYKGTDNYLNPATGLAWTVDELDALQAGIVIKE